MKPISRKALTIGGICGIILSSTATGIATYKSYPKIKEAVDQKMSLREAIKHVAKDYIPAAGIVVATGGVVLASEIIGERKINNLKTQVSHVTSKFNTVKQWYKDQSDAIKEVAPKEITDALDNLIEEKEVNNYIPRLKLDNKVYQMYDTITGTVFDATKTEVMLALDVINKNLTTVQGYGMYEDLYSNLGLKLPPEFYKFGWSLGTASAMWVDPWLSVKFEEGFVKHFGKVMKIFYVADRGDGEFMPFDPVENPESEDWL